MAQGFDPASIGATAVADFDPASVGAQKVADFDPVSVGAKAVIAKQTPPYTISAAPTGILPTLESAISDVRHGTDITLLGKILKKMGAPGIDTGVSPAVGETIGGPVVGPLRAAHGVGSVATAKNVGQGVRGANEAIGGVLQAAAPVIAATNPEFIPIATQWGLVQKGINKGAEKVGMSPENAELAGNVVMLGSGLPGLLKGKADVRTPVLDERVSEPTTTAAPNEAVATAAQSDSFDPTTIGAKPVADVVTPKSVTPDASELTQTAKPIAAVDTVGTAEGAAADTKRFQDARAELGPNASLSDVAQLAQNKKAIATPAKTTGVETPSVISEAAKSLASDETGTMNFSKLHEAASDEIRNEVQPFLSKTKATLGQALDEVTHLIAPRAGATRETLDSVFKQSGAAEQHAYGIDSVLGTVRGAFEKMSRDEQAGFIDRSKLGRGQATPEMQSVADFMQKTDFQSMRELVDTQIKGMSKSANKMWSKMSDTEKDSFTRQIASFKGDETLPDGPLKEIADGVTNFKENHNRVIWKTLPKPFAEGEAALAEAKDNLGPNATPGELAQESARIQQEQTGKNTGRIGGRSPLEGSKGFMRQSTLDTMREGIMRGGEPVTYNPVRMFEMAQKDMWRYITAQRMWQDAADQGARVFVKRGSRTPDGFSKIGDKIGNVSFPAKSGEGNIQAGEWAMRDDYARLLKNHLSTDYVRGSRVGAGLMEAKNLMTQYRLQLSPFFHAITTSVSSIGSNIGHVAAGAVDAVRHGDISKLTDAAKEAKTPVGDYKSGSDLVRYAGNRNEFLATTRGKDFITKYPEAGRMVDDLFAGGAKLAMHEDERVSQIAKMREAFANREGNPRKPIEAALRSPLAAVELAAKPLYQYYVPRMKVAAWLRDYSKDLVDRAPDLAAGKTTRGELARKNWDNTDNMYGQVNWDARYWNRTFKSGVQIAFRAPMWAIGNVKTAANALSGQSREFMESARWMADHYSDSNATAKKVSDTIGRPLPSTTAVPRLDKNFSKVLGLVIGTAAFNTASQVLSGNGPPKDYKDLMAGRIGTRKDGSPMRTTIPAIVVKDAIQVAYGGVWNYAKAKTSDWLAGLTDVVTNSDFRGAMIHHPEDSFWQRRYDDLKHVVGSPVGIATALRARDEGGDKRSMVAGFMGFTPAPKEIDMSKGAIAAQEFHRAYAFKNQTSDSIIKGQKTHDLTMQYQSGKTPLQKIRAMENAGEITAQQEKKITADPRGNLVDNFRDLPLEKALDYWPDYSKEEQGKLAVVLRKRASTIDRLDRTATQKLALKGRAKAVLGAK